MKGFILVLVRVLWPTIAGWLSAKYGIEIDEQTQQEIIDWISTGIIGLSAFIVEFFIYINCKKKEAKNGMRREEERR